MRQKFKKVLSTLVSMVLVATLTLTVFATSQPMETADAITAEYTGSDLAAKADELGFDLVTEDGYHLEKIIVSAHEIPSPNEQTNNVATPKVWKYINLTISIITKIVGSSL